MTIAPTFDLHSEAELPDISFAAMRMVMLHEAQEHDLPVLLNSDREISCGTPFGTFGIRAQRQGLRLSVAAARQDWLFMLKEGMVAHMAEFMPDAVAALRWSDDEGAGGLPPNFQFAKVVAVEALGTAFKRLRIKAGNLDSYGDDAIHFRVVLPPAEHADVVWPHVGENGATVWPKGDQALHRPVYTARWIDQAAGLIDVDIFIHEGGRMTDWVAQVVPGTTAAIVGPGGGGIPQTDRINLYGDETGFPAIGRILDSLPANAVGRVVLMSDAGADCAYPISAPAGMTLDWLRTADQPDLAAMALADLDRTPDHFLWFAAEKSQVQPLRAVMKDKGLNSANSYIASYWSKT